MQGNHEGSEVGEEACISFGYWVGAVESCGNDILLEMTSRGPSGRLLMSGVSGGGSRLSLDVQDGDILYVSKEGYTGVKS